MKRVEKFFLVAIASVSGLASAAIAQSLEKTDIQAPNPDIADVPLEIDRDLSRTPDLGAAPAQTKMPAGDTHVGRIWVTPVLIQQQGGLAGASRRGVVRVTAPGGTVRVRGGDGADGSSRSRRVEEQIAESIDDKKEDGGDSGGGGGGIQSQPNTVFLQQQMKEQQRQAEEEDRANRERAQQEIAAMRRDEATERRMCRREARNAWETFTGWFGAKHTEECRSSVRRRETVRVAETSAVDVSNILYFINLSANNTTNVQIVCRIRDRGETLSAEISVLPLDFGEWSPPCACDEDYKFWCTLSSAEPIAAHAIQTQKSATQESLEYIDFFLIK